MRLLHAFTAALAVGHAAAITYVQVVGAIDGVTKKSRSLTVTVESVNFLNVIVTAPLIAIGFVGIVADVVKAAPMLIGPPFPAAEAKVVVKALTTFVNVHKALLNVVIGKNGLISRAPGGVQGIRLALVALEKGVDSFAFALIALIPTEKESATLQFGSLSATLTTTVKKYGG